jgi:membrane-bound metal-dependent hydrolase YbcI (DUF457 family)
MRNSLYWAHPQILYSLLPKGQPVFIPVVKLSGYSTGVLIKPFSQIFSLCFISYLSHIIIDFFEYSGDYSHRGGMPLFWPISTEKFPSLVSLYLAFHYDRLSSASTIEWVKSMLDLYNFSAIVHEAVWILPFIFVGQWYRRSYRRGQLT